MLEKTEHRYLENKELRGHKVGPLMSHTYLLLLCQVHSKLLRIIKLEKGERKGTEV